MIGLKYGAAFVLVEDKHIQENNTFGHLDAGWGQPCSLVVYGGVCPSGLDIQ
jgi:hypothetical protein